MKISIESLISEGVQLQGADVQRRARAVMIAAVIVSTVALYIAWLQYVQGNRLLGMTAFPLAMLSAAGGEFARRTGHWRPVGAGICAGIFIIVASVVGITGGSVPSASFYLGLVPVVATIFFGARVGASVVAVNIVYLTAIEALRRNDFEFPLWIPEEAVAR